MDYYSTYFCGDLRAEIRVIYTLHKSLGPLHNGGQNVTWHNVTGGCTEQFINQTGDINLQRGDTLHSVRCCNKKDKCKTPKDPCQRNKTYEEAKTICYQRGLSLCVRNKRINSKCCRKGCDIDTSTMWIADD